MSFIWNALFGSKPKTRTFAPQPDNAPLKMYKVVVIGADSSGKSSICRMVHLGTDKAPTVVIAMEIPIIVNIPVNPDLILDSEPQCDIRVWLIDLPRGCADVNSIPWDSNHFRGTTAAIVVYDASDANTFTHVDNSITVLKRSNKDVVVMLVANKIDLPRQVTIRDGLTCAERHNTLYFECCAQKYEDVQSMLIELTTAMRIIAVSGEVHFMAGRISNIYIQRKQFQVSLFRTLHGAFYSDVIFKHE